MKKLWILVFAISILGVACQSESNSNTEGDQTEHSKNVDDSKEDNSTTKAATQVSEVLSPSDFMAKFEASDGGQLVDVRSAKEVAAGSVEGAANIDFYADDFKDQIAKLDKEKPLFVYCKSGGRSGQTATICKELGFKEVYDMEGGYTAYSAE